MKCQSICIRNWSGMTGKVQIYPHIFKGSWVFPQVYMLVGISRKGTLVQNTVLGLL